MLNGDLFCGMNIMLRTVKPDFHSHLLSVASKSFPIGHAQIGETRRIGQKNTSRSVSFEVQIFQLPGFLFRWRNFSPKETRVSDR